MKYVKVGEHSLKEVTSYEQSVPIFKWVTYKNARPERGPKQYGQWIRETGGIDGDYSILVLGKEVRFTQHVQPICLPPLPDQTHSNFKVAWVSGWGYTKVNLNKGIVEYGELSDVPKRVPMLTINAKTCRGNSLRINCKFCETSTMICAYGKEKFNSSINVDSCMGDSGGNELTDTIKIK